ncbi:MAG: hydantoinase/oxoprolinase N-terminal domain-containing protein, partial [Myxococcota bacterium]|nr:hydantoinase/oxoprolinase N-terminal domain-containing protein [Myxococcota bacterium]
MSLRLGVDIGGTFTDAVSVGPEGLRTAKVATDPQDPSRGVERAVQALFGDAATAPDAFLHGTTLVTNMMLERQGCPTGFVTTRGCRDLLHIGRHDRPLNYAIRQQIPRQHAPPVPRRWRRELQERMGADGEILVAPDRDETQRVARELVGQGVQAIAVGFLHAHRFPGHERQVAAWIAEVCPDTCVVTSHEVSARFREYERFMTTAWNARVSPGAADYLDRLRVAVQQRWPGVGLTLVTSNGGLETIESGDMTVPGSLRRTPIRLAMSGPAAA